MAKEDKTQIRVAIIGLMGVVLTTCGGVTGATISGAVTVYQVERRAQRPVLPAPGGDQSLILDGEQIEIDPGAAAALDTGQYRVFSDPGFVLALPRPGWAPLEELRYRDLFADQAALSPMVGFYSLAGFDWDKQRLYRIRRPPPTEIHYHRGSSENGVPVDLDLLRSVAGGDVVAHYSQITILTIDQEATVGLPLPEIALAWGELHGFSVNQIVADDERGYVFLQSSWPVRDVTIDGQNVDLSIERWALFAAGPQTTFVVEINYVPWGDQTSQVWKDLQAYLNAFRVIR